MAGNYMTRIFLLIAFSMTRTLVSMGNDGSPHHPFRLNYMFISHVLCDSVPEQKKNTEETANPAQTIVIKEVPKSHKQIKPIAIPNGVSIKPISPVKIIKPKIIKPVIKIH